MAKRTHTNKTTVKEKDFKLPVSQLGRMFDMGFDIGGGVGRAGRPNKPYSQVEWVWICVNLIINVSKSIQLVLSNASEEIVENGDAYDLLFNNPNTPISKFLSETIGYYTLFREVYWIFTDKNLLSPKNIIVAGPDQCKPVIDNGVVTGYKLQAANGQQIPLFIEDVWQITNFNPDRSYRGSGPLEAGSLAISSSHQATQYNEATLANGAKLGTMLVAPAGVKFDDAERRALIAQFESVHKGARNAGKTFLATGGLDVKTMGQTMAELQMIDLRKYDAGTICALFGVPPELVSLNSEAQYAHGPATQRFLMYTISPLLSDIAENISSGILQTFRFKTYTGVAQAASKSYAGSRLPIKSKASFKAAKIKAIQSAQKLFAWFDVESHPAVQEMERDKAEKVMKYTTYGVPLNDIIEAYDLPFTQNPWGNEFFISPALMPARWIMDAGPEGLAAPSLPEGGDEPEPPEKSLSSVPSVNSVANEKDNNAQKLRIWNNWKNSWAGIEREYQEALRKFFLRQQRELLDKLSDATKAEPNEVIARVVFDLQKENGKIRAINQTFFDKASELGIRQIASEIGMAADARNLFVETAKRNAIIRRALAVQAKKITGINTTTQRMVANQLKAGLDKGEGLNGLTNRIREVLGSNRQRALSIARTQTAGAIGSGRHVGMKDAGIELKIWLTSGDKDVRETHRDAGKRYAKGIPLDEPFVIGGDFLMHPAEAGGSPANVINCRCVELAAKSGGKELSLQHYANLKFISYEEVKNGQAN